MTNPTDAAAPHGRDDEGKPLAPYGLNLDGTPRKSNRGARPGQRGNGGSRGKVRAIPSASHSNLTDIERKGMLTELADMMIVMPLASASQIPFIAAKFGAKQTDALAGDALIISHFMPSIADGLILLSKTKPQTLAWLDKAEQNAPYLVLANAVIQAGKALVENHFNPNENLAIAGRSLAAMKMAKVAEAVKEQAAGYGIGVPDTAEAAA